MPPAVAVPPIWNVRMVNCVPGSPIDCAARIPTASPVPPVARGQIVPVALRADASATRTSAAIGFHPSIPAFSIRLAISVLITSASLVMTSSVIRFTMLSHAVLPAISRESATSSRSPR